MILYLTPKSKICLVLEGILFTKHNVARVKWLLGILDISSQTVVIQVIVEGSLDQTF